MSDPQDQNPFASPQSEESPLAPLVSTISEAPYVVTPLQSTLPKRCYRCNALARKKTAVTATGWVSVTSIAARITVTAYLCDQHSLARRSLSLLSGLLVIAVFVAFLLSWPIAELTSVAAVPALFPAAVVLAATWYYRRRKADLDYEPLAIERVRGDRVWIKGTGAPFRESLEQHPPVKGWV
ncbi:MAG: hypothetical protein AAGJ46_05790 [Planctomycetota bacterium]